MVLASIDPANRKMLYVPGRPHRDKNLPISRGLSLLGMIAFSAAAWTLIIAACLAFWAGIAPALL
ncbi:MAG TPA: hypothetical protein VG757_07725 [Devosia sp.]|nr:hypothetical protein [Devosia sp.]